MNKGIFVYTTSYILIGDFMIKIEKYGKTLGLIFGPLLILLFIFTSLNYIDIISYKVFTIIRFILLIGCLFIGSYIYGKTVTNKGWLEGLKLGLIIIVIFMFFNYIIFRLGFNIKHIIYYIIILGSTTLGCILGINKKITKQ